MMKTYCCKSIKSALVIVILSISFVSCTTLPQPDESDSGILIVPVIRSPEHGGSPYAYVRLQITREGDKLFRRWVNIYSGSNNKIVSNLPAGEYILSKYTVIEKSDKSIARNEKMNVNVSVLPGHITISTICFSFSISDELFDDKYNDVDIIHVPLNEEKKHNVIQELSVLPNFSMWIIH